MRVATEHPPRNLTTMFFQYSIKNDYIAKEIYFKVYAFMKVSKENKFLYYEPCLHKMGFHTMNY